MSKDSQSEYWESPGWAVAQRERREVIRAHDYGAVRERVARLPEDQWHAWLLSQEAVGAWLVRMDAKPAAQDANTAEVERVITLRNGLEAAGASFEEVG